MIRTLTRTFAACLAMLLAACSTPGVDTYQSGKPTLVLERFFDGPLKGWGTVQDRSGKVLRRFVVDIDARWAGSTGTLDEHFVFDDGERQRRVWTLTRQPDGSYTGRAHDVVGEAQGRGAGYAFNFAYTLKVPVDGREIELAIDDWMYLVDDNNLINRSEMKKFGIRVGDITLLLQKQGRTP